MSTSPAYTGAGYPGDQGAGAGAGYPSMASLQQSQMSAMSAMRYPAYSDNLAAAKSEYSGMQNMENLYRSNSTHVK